MKIVTYGGGTNSTAMIIGMVKRGTIPDRILFSDTGGERPDTYEFIDMFSDWLEQNGAPRVIKLHYITKDGHRLRLNRIVLNIRHFPLLLMALKAVPKNSKRASPINSAKMTQIVKPFGKVAVKSINTSAMTQANRSV